MKFLHKTIAFLLVAFFLVGCVQKTKVGPVCRSCKPYSCRGRWHFPQLFYDYNAVGVASFYGKECHGKPMANGEKFNRLAMTAAHRTLPLPSVVMVTSLITGKSIVVVITDRGPFHYWDRTIDLSEGASKALGIGNFKPSQVRIKTLVADSLALSTYISRYCRKGRDQFGRSWEQVYFQEIAGRKIHAYKGSRG